MLANKWLGLIPVNPLSEVVTSEAVELVNTDFGKLLEAEVTEGLIKAAIENKLGFVLVVCSGNSVSSGVALEKSQLRKLAVKSKLIGKSKLILNFFCEIALKFEFLQKVTFWKWRENSNFTNFLEFCEKPLIVRSQENFFQQIKVVK